MNLYSLFNNLMNQPDSKESGIHQRFSYIEEILQFPFKSYQLYQ